MHFHIEKKTVYSFESYNATERQTYTGVKNTPHFTPGIKRVLFRDRKHFQQEFYFIFSLAIIRRPCCSAPDHRVGSTNIAMLTLIHKTETFPGVFLIYCAFAAPEIVISSVLTVYF